MPTSLTVSLSGDNNINQVVGGLKWDTLNLTYSIPGAEYYEYTGYPDGWTSSNSKQIVAAEAAMRMYSSVSGLTLTKITESANIHADLRFGNTSTGNDGAGAWGPGPLASDGDIWFDTDATTGGGFSDPDPGDYAWYGFVHEAGHALGLKHPHETSAQGFPGGGLSMDYSIMSYRAFDNASIPTFDWNNTAFAQTPMMYDIAALQYLYGADYGAEANNTDTVYVWDENQGYMTFNGSYWPTQTPQNNKVYMTLWDGGGNDTYDLSSRTTALKIDLRPGEWSTFSEAQLVDLDGADIDGNGIDVKARGNVANALLYQDNWASLIENAIGGSNNDDIKGNQTANDLEGRGGHDTIVGWDGNDTINGNDGNDSLNGYGHDDIVNGDSGNDTLYGSGGNDSLYGGGYVGDENDHLYGETGTDLLVGSGGDDYLDGGDDTNADRLHGGWGNDTYVLRANDVFASNAESGQGQDAEINGTGGGIDTVNSFLFSYTLQDSFENLTLFDGAFSGFGNGGANTLTGNANANTFYGYADADALWGHAGNDSLYGGLGSDTLYGGDHDDLLYGEFESETFTIDTLYGQNGNDTYFVTAGDVIQEFDGQGFDIVWSMSASFTLSDYLESLFFTAAVNSQNLTATGNNQANTISGYSGADSLSGAGGDDTISAGGAADTIMGGAGADSLNGGTGNDTFLYFVGDIASGESVDGGADFDVISSNAATVDLRGMTISNVESIVGTFTDGIQFFANTLSTALAIQGNIGNDSLTASNLTFTAEQRNTLLFSRSIETLTDSTGTYTQNSAPAISGVTASQSLGDQATVSPFQNATLSDPNGDTLYVTVTISSTANGNLTSASLSGWTGTGTPGQYAISGSAAAVTNAVRALVFDPAENQVNVGSSVSTTVSLAVRDRSSGGLTANASTSLTVTSQNDAPTITSDGGGLLVTMSIAENTTAVTQVAASDPDPGATLTYSLLPSSGASFFTINPTTGVLAFSSAPDFENPGQPSNQYGFAVRVSDGNGGIDEQSFLITVTDQNTFTGTTGPNTLTGDNGPDTISGGLGDDTLVGLEGPNQLNGGEGSDTASYGWTGSNVSADLRTNRGSVAGVPTDNYSSIENLTGGSGHDILSGDGSVNVLNGAGGNDALYGWAGDDVLIGGAVNGGQNQLWGGDGIDTASYLGTGGAVAVDLRSQSGRVNNALVDRMSSIENATGGSGNDTLLGNDLANNLNGAAGNDILYGFGGNDVLLGGAVSGGQNQLWGGDGIDTASYVGTAGAVAVDLRSQLGRVNSALVDRMNSIENATGGSGNDTLVGNDLANVLEGAAGNDVLYGFGGNDVLLGGGVTAGGRNQLWGGDGIDSASYEGTSASVYADLAGKFGRVGGVLTDLMNSIENATGGSGNDTLIGDGSVNVLSGAAGNDVLKGEGGNDVLLGGGVTAGGRNQLWGGDGEDTASYAGNASDHYVNLAAQAGYLKSGGQLVLTDTMSSIEHATGGSGTDTLIGTNVTNLLRGGFGADALHGLGGNDVLQGGAGNDQLWGGDGLDWADYADQALAVMIDLGNQTGRGAGAGADSLSSIENARGGAGLDTIRGSTGANLIEGGGGRDILYGLAGADTFVYRLASDSRLAGGGYDTIGDFLNGTDKLNLSVFGITAAKVSIQSSASATSLYADVDGVAGFGSNDLAIAFTGANAITTADLIF